MSGSHHLSLEPSGAAEPSGLGPALQRWLQAETGEVVTLIETHISWVLLDREHAYKVKKPVRMPFLDFTDPAQRLQACQEELRLNRRLAPSLYLDLVAVGGSAVAPRLLVSGSCDPVIDHAVRMRRFGADALLADQVLAGTLETADLRGLGRDLAAFHRTADAAVPCDDYASPTQIRGAVNDVLAQLEATGHAGQVAVWREWSAARAKVLEPLWAARRSSGFVREGHGDLHLGNVVWFEGRWQAFDCLEFQPALRWLDVMNDIGFLTMDLRAHGRPDLAAGLLDDYLQQGGDYEGLRLLRFYEFYRALVRLLVASLKGDPQPTGCEGNATGQGSGEPGSGSVRVGLDSPQVALTGHSPDYPRCLRELLQVGSSTPRLVLMHGLSGSGKSTVARRLVEHQGMVRLRSDVERKRLFGLRPEQSSTANGQDIYNPEAHARTFDHLETLARAVLESGYSVVVDATFLRREERRRFQRLAMSLGVEYGILDCQASLDTLRARLRQRMARGEDPSEADETVLERQLSWREGWGEDELAFVQVEPTE